MISSWRIHSISYLSATVKSEKIKHQDWAIHQAKKVETLGEPALKFANQLNRIFTAPTFNLEFLKERIDAAYEYFYKTLDEVLLTSLKKMEEVKRKTKIKQYFEELVELDEIQTDVILNLKKVRLMLEAIILEKPIQKSQIWNDELKLYKITKLALARQDIRQNMSLLDLEDEDDYEEEIPVKKSKAKKVKVEKIPSAEITLNFFVAGKSVSEIAKERLLSESTIYSHAGQLLKAEKLELNQILTEEKITELEEVFKDFNGESVSPLKEKYGDQFSWEELRLYRMSLLK
ncbi:MAG: helix-turn-helix domain-containing protein [Bacteroidota bacterium]